MLGQNLVSTRWSFTIKSDFAKFHAYKILLIQWNDPQTYARDESYEINLLSSLAYAPCSTPHYQHYGEV